jgi:hypothetical protein
MKKLILALALVVASAAPEMAQNFANAYCQTCQQQTRLMTSQIT